MDQMRRDFFDAPPLNKKNPNIEKDQYWTKISFFFAVVIMPLIIGGMIYIIFRSKSLVMFSWIQSVGLTKYIDVLRLFLFPIKEYLPNWFIYSFPNALWAFSMLSFFALLWRDNKICYYCWILLGVILSLGMELLQLGGFIAGTFSADDLIVLCVTYVFFGIIFR